MNTGFGNSHFALFHHLVDRRTIHVAHLVELIDANDTAIGQHHGASFQTTFARFLIGGNGGR